MENTLRAIIKLTRWREFVPFTTILTWLGGLVAYRVRDATLDWRLFVILVANLGAVAYAFMINDIEDADDDIQDRERGQRNPVAMNEISRSAAWLASIGVAVIAAFAYAVAGWVPFILGVITLILAHLYSWKPVRLKARPLVDILSHALFLSTLLFLVAYYIYADELGSLWILALGTFLISANGQLYNQVRDYEADRLAGLHNTASILGKRVTDWLETGSVVGAGVCLLIAIFQGVFPLWLGPILVITVPIMMFVYRHNTRDMRGSETEDLMGLIQRQFLAVVNVTLLVWLIVAYLEQLG
ncbi:MAG: prenyltransferase [Chloroflexi bacterium]|nr:prenyltransferase [Chloroflexota bacterium]